MSQTKEFEEPNHHHISVRWWNTYYQVACLSSNNKRFDALEKAVKMLMLNEKEGIPVKLECFTHLPIYNRKDLPIKFKVPNFPEYTNYPNLKVQPRELHAFEKHPFFNSLSQEVVAYDHNLFTVNFLFHTFFENENIEQNIVKSNKIDHYSLLIDTFKEMTNHMEDHCDLEDIMEVRKFFNKKILESKNKAVSVLTDSNNDDSEYLSVTLPSSKKRKTHGTKHY